MSSKKPKITEKKGPTQRHSMSENLIISRYQKKNEPIENNKPKINPPPRGIIPK